MLQLDVQIAGETTAWGPDLFARVPKLSGTNRAGEARDVWSLRALVDVAVGSGARVAAVHGAGETSTITPEEWADPKRIPILHTTRRGALKFRWASPEGEWEESAMRQVTSLDIVR